VRVGGVGILLLEVEVEVAVEAGRVECAAVEGGFNGAPSSESCWQSVNL
jgi:hypothetical protein